MPLRETIPELKVRAFARPRSARQAKQRLRAAGLRLTKARLMLCKLLFVRKNRHVTAAMLRQEAQQEMTPISLATIYNTLHEFAELGLLRPLKIDGDTCFYDTNLSHHQHFFVDDTCELIDAPSKIQIKKLPEPPDCYAVDRVDVVIRLRRKRSFAENGALMTEHKPF
jgi:Fur family iron response transcriptional regulator